MSMKIGVRHQQSPTVCTLGACEHLFCRECCKTFVGTNCPLCNLPSHVKDARVNQQLSNLVSLCQELGRIFTCQEEYDGTAGACAFRYETKQQCFPKPVTTVTRVKSKVKQRLDLDGCSTPTKPASNINGHRHERKLSKSLSPSSPATYTLSTGTVVGRSSRVSDQGDADRDDATPRRGRDDATPRRGRARDRASATKDAQDQSASLSKICAGGKRNTTTTRSRSRRRGGVSMDAKTTMTHLCEDSFNEDGEESDNRDDGNIKKAKKNSCDDRPHPRKRTSSRTAVKSEDQSTMTEFFEYNDELPLLDMGEEGVSTAINPKPKTPGVETTPRRDSITPRGRSRKSWARDDAGPAQGPAQGPSTSSTSRNGRKRVRSQRGTSSSASLAEDHSTPCKKGKNVLEGNLKESSAKKNARGETPLHVAAIKGDIDRVVSLLKSGTNTNVRDNAGWTPLHECCNHGHTAIVELLLGSGAQINIPGMDNDTPLHDAVANYRLAVVELLVSKGASLTARNIHGSTPLDLAKTEEMRNSLNTPVMFDLQNVKDISMDECEEEFQVLCFLGTALSRDQGLSLQRCASILHAKVVDTFTPEVSHVITACNYEGQCPRTLKYLNAVLAGKWVVSCEWLDVCVEYKQKVCEDAFEVPGSSTNPDSHAASRGRQNRRQQLPGLFDGCQFYFHGSFATPTPDKEELQSLVRRGGGKILTREPKPHNIGDYTSTVPYHAADDSGLKDYGVYVIHDNKASYPDVARETSAGRMRVLPAAWIMDCIASFTILHPHK